MSDAIADRIRKRRAGGAQPNYRSQQAAESDHSDEDEPPRTRRRTGRGGSNGTTGNNAPVLPVPVFVKNTYRYFAQMPVPVLYVQQSP